MRPEQREAIINAFKTRSQKRKTKAKCVKHLQAVGLLTPSGKHSPVYYPKNSS